MKASDRAIGKVGEATRVKAKKVSPIRSPKSSSDMQMTSWPCLHRQPPCLLTAVLPDEADREAASYQAGARHAWSFSFVSGVGQHSRAGDIHTVVSEVEVG